MKHFIFATILFLMAGVIFTNQAMALTISPVKAELSGDPGHTVQSEIILFNEQKEAKTFYASFENFEAQGESGTPNFVPGKEGLATWIKVPAEITLESGEKKTIPFSIVIPKDAEPGGHFAAVFWSTVPPQTQGGGQVAVGAKIGSLILLKVSGETKEGGGVLEFGAINKQKFFSSLPISFMYRFQNSGSDRVKPEGEIKIKNTFGLTSVTLNANEKEGNVLPSSVRKFTTVWAGNDLAGDNSNAGFFGMVKKQWNNFTFGRYSANLHLKYGQDKQVDASYSLFVVPWQLLTVLLLLLLMLGIFIFFGFKKWDKWIISKALEGKTISEDDTIV